MYVNGIYVRTYVQNLICKMFDERQPQKFSPLKISHFMYICTYIHIQEFIVIKYKNIKKQSELLYMHAHM